MTHLSFLNIYYCFEVVPNWPEIYPDLKFREKELPAPLPRCESEWCSSLMQLELREPKGSQAQG